MTRKAASLPQLVDGQGSTVRDIEGHTWIDLVMGFGACLLGHAQPAIVAALQAQAGRLWVRGRCPTPSQTEVDRQLAALLPAGLRLASLQSTGMEGAELALRIAAIQTGRSEFVGMARSMHGKSVLTAALCWQNAPIRPTGQVHTLPFPGPSDEAEILDRLRRLLARGRVAALWIELIQGSNEGLQASDAFYRESAALCRESGSLLVVDEILTGLYRCGPVFLSPTLGLAPDVLLFAKCMGNGFPVSAVALAEPIELPANALPGSTFAANPLALAAVRSTLEVMSSLPMRELVAGVESVVRGSFEPLAAQGMHLRGHGALWHIRLDDAISLASTLDAILEAGVLVTAAGQSIRLLPAATIPLELLEDACARIVRALRDVQPA